MNNVLERLPAATAAFPLDAKSQGIGLDPGVGTPIGRIAGDAVDLLRRPAAGDIMTGGAFGIVSQLIDLVRHLVSSFGQNQRYFSNATASSTGDPHLAFSGTQDGGNSRQAHFDSMTPHGDLLDSASFSGGYRVSTQVTQPGTNGVTYNREAAISTNFGQTRVSLDNAGHAEIRSGGHAYAVGQGQTIDLGNGERVTRNADGSLAVVDENGMGGHVTTRLSENGAGVDVNVEAENVALGGDLVTATAPPQVRQPL